MPLKKIRFGQEEIFEIRIIDINGQKIGDWKCMKSDFVKVVNIICKKHGLSFSYKPERDRDRDLDWAM